MLKKKLTEAAVLGIFNQHSVTEVHTDASVYDFGAILLQKDCDNLLHHILYEQENYTSTAKIP
jgi:hypothetical protein